VWGSELTEKAVPATHNERRRGQQPGTAIQDLRGAVEIGLGTTIKYLRR
jgi:hypothetical protein